MSKNAKACQTILVVWFSILVVEALIQAESWLAVGSSRALGLLFLGICVRLVLIWKISTSPRNWSLGLGWLSAFCAVVAPFSFLLRNHRGVGAEYGVIWRANFPTDECVSILLAVCCFILAAELRKTSARLSPSTPGSVAPTVGADVAAPPSRA